MLNYNYKYFESEINNCNYKYSNYYEGVKIKGRMTYWNNLKIFMYNIFNDNIIILNVKNKIKTLKIKINNIQDKMIGYDNYCEMVNKSTIYGFDEFEMYKNGRREKNFFYIWIYENV